MSEHTGIEWTDHTFNIAWGCQKVSPGCANCYAEHDAHRHGFDVWGPAKTTERRTFESRHWNDPLRWNWKAQKEGSRRWVFCSSMCDVFEDHPTIDHERAKLWPLIRATPWLDWQLLTKRPERIAANLPADWGLGYLNVWLGTSVESEEYTDRIKQLVRVPARLRFLSCEPLLGPLSVFPWLGLIDWVIIGGESQPGCRPMDPGWAERLVDECHARGVPVFVKQLGGYPDKRDGDQALVLGRRYIEMPR